MASGCSTFLNPAYVGYYDPTNVQGVQLIVDVYRFADGTTVFDPSFFRSKVLCDAVTSFPLRVKQQLIEFFRAQDWSSGRCIFYVPLHAYASFGCLAAVLCATRVGLMFKKPFGEPLDAYAFSIEDLVIAASSVSNIVFLRFRTQRVLRKNFRFGNFYGVSVQYLE